jgi:hypothetical protein
MSSNVFLISSVHLSLSVAVCLVCLLNVSKIKKMLGVPDEQEMAGETGTYRMCVVKCVLKV